MEHLCVSPLRFATLVTISFLTMGCVRDEPAPAAKPAIAQPGVQAQVPIVDMSPSAQNPVVQAPTSAVSRPPATTPAAPPAATVDATPAAGPARRPTPSPAASIATGSDVVALRSRGLAVPVAGISAARLVGSFSDARGNRVHEALDIPAPRGTPVVSTDDGTVLKLFTSRGGGLTVYVADPSRQFIYYYAHLDAYAPGLAERQAVTKGQPIGTVGTTGNAPPNTPHLHFAILRNDDMTRWWTGTPIDPFLVLRPASAR